jgi:hypothetical protein
MTMKQFSAPTFNAEQLEARRNTIGASEIGRVMNGDWASLYREKIGEVEVDLSDVFQVQLGKHTELFNLYWLMKTKPEYFDDESRNLNERIINGGGIQSINQSDCNAISATPDGYCCINGVLGVVDTKHTNDNSWGKEKYDTPEERVIDTYKWQMQQQMLCTAHSIAIISPIYGNKFGPPIILHKDEEMQQQIITEAEKFWEHIELRVPPENPDAIEGPKVEHDNMRVISEKEFKGWNAYSEWCDLVPDYIASEKAVKRNKSIKEWLKGAMPDDVKSLTGNGLTGKRDKRGRVTFKYGPQS